MFPDSTISSFFDWFLTCPKPCSLVAAMVFCLMELLCNLDTSSRSLGNEALCISFLLCTVLPQTWWLKTFIDYHTVFVYEMSDINGILGFGSPKGKSRCKLHSYMKDLGENELPSFIRLLVDSIPYSSKTEILGCGPGAEPIFQRSPDFLIMGPSPSSKLETLPWILFMIQIPWTCSFAGSF